MILAQLSPFIVDNVPLLSNDNDKTAFYFGAAYPCTCYLDRVAVAVEQVGHDCGFLNSILYTPNNPWEVDEVNVIDMTAVFGLPASCSNDDFLAGKNAALVGAYGRWELIYFRDAVRVGTTGLRYKLSHLLRGRLGSEVMCGGHGARDTVILDVQNLARVETTLAPGAGAVDFASPGEAPTGAFRGSLTTLGSARLPWAPHGLKAAVAGSDVVLTWNRSDRSGVSIHDGDGNVPLTDPPETYTLNIATLTGTVLTPKRLVYNIHNPTWTYTAAKMTADGVTISSGFYYRLTQNNAIGRGWPAGGYLHVG